MLKVLCDVHVRSVALAAASAAELSFLCCTLSNATHCSSLVRAADRLSKKDFWFVCSDTDGTCSKVRRHSKSLPSLSRLAHSARRVGICHQIGLDWYSWHAFACSLTRTRQVTCRRWTRRCVQLPCFPVSTGTLAHESHARRHTACTGFRWPRAQGHPPRADCCISKGLVGLFRAHVHAIPSGIRVLDLRSSSQGPEAASGAIAHAEQLLQGVAA